MWQGLTVVLTLNSGDKFEGLLSGSMLSPSNSKIALKMVKKVQSASAGQTNGTAATREAAFIGASPEHTMNFDVKDLTDMTIPEFSIPENSKLANGMRLCVATRTRLILDLQAPRPVSRLTPTFLATRPVENASFKNGSPKALIPTISLWSRATQPPGINLQQILNSSAPKVHMMRTYTPPPSTGTLRPTSAERRKLKRLQERSKERCLQIPMFEKNVVRLSKMMVRMKKKNTVGFDATSVLFHLCQSAG